MIQPGAMPPLSSASVCLALALASGSRAAAAELPAAIRAELADAEREGVELRARPRAARSGGGTEIVMIDGELDGIPFDRPLGAWVRGVATHRAITPRPFGPVLRGPIAVDRGDAIARVAASGLPGTREDASATLLWRSSPESTRRVWRVDGRFDPTHMTHPVFEVDAETGAVRQVHEHVREASIRTYPTNPVVTPELDDIATIDLPAGETTLTSPRLRATSCSVAGVGTWSGLPGCTVSQAALADADGDFLFEPASDDTPIFDDAFAEASAYSHADRFTAAMLEHGVDGWACLDDGGGTPPLSLVANYHEDGPEPHRNSYYTAWCTRGVLMGQGPSADSSYDGDMIYHELGHAVVHATVDTFLGQPRRRVDGYVRDADALNEAYADFFSSSHTGDPLVGEHWGTMRDNDNELACPTSFIGQQHYDSEAFAGALWQLYVQHGEASIDVVLDSISMLPPDATFEEAAAALVAVTSADLGDAAGDTISDELAARGLLDCPRLRTYEPLLELMLAPRGEFVAWAPPPFQIVIDVPDDAGELSFTIESFDLAELSFVPVNALVRVGEPLEFEYSGEREPYTVDAVHDHSIVDVPYMQRVTIPVVPGEPVYLAVVNRELSAQSVIVDGVQFEPTGPSDDSSSSAGAGTDSGSGTTEGLDGSTGTMAADSTGDGTSTGDTAPASDEGSGCSCSTHTTTAPLFGLVLLAFVRRRRPSAQV